MGRALNRVRERDEFIAGTFKNGVGERRYKLFRPSAGKMPAAGKRMLIVVLHGCTQDADDIARGTRFNETASRDGFLVVYPEQPESAHPRKCWNWYLPEQRTRGSGEAAIIADLTARIVRDEGVDPARVFIAGISAGAAMAANLAAYYPDIFAAAALHSGLPALAGTDVTSALELMSKGPADADEAGETAFRAMGTHARVVPVIIVHGVNDAAVSIRNLAATARQWVVTNARAAGAAPPDPVEVHPADGRLSGMRYVLSNGTVLAESWRIEGLAHAWSGGSASGSYTDPSAPDATGLMLEFFNRHPRPQ